MVGSRVKPGVITGSVTSACPRRRAVRHLNDYKITGGQTGSDLSADQDTRPVPGSMVMPFGPWMRLYVSGSLSASWAWT